MAHGQRIPGTGRTAGSRNDAPDRSRHHRPLCRALRTDHRRAVRQGRGGRYAGHSAAHREERYGVPEEPQVAPSSTLRPVRGWHMKTSKADRITIRFFFVRPACFTARPRAGPAATQRAAQHTNKKRLTFP